MQGIIPQGRRITNAREQTTIISLRDTQVPNPHEWGIMRIMFQTEERLSDGPDEIDFDFMGQVIIKNTIEQF